MTPEVRAFLEGMLTCGYLVAALFFVRFWRVSGDRLFAFFGASFTLLAIQRVAMVLVRGAEDEAGKLYVLRLLAYLLILIAIYDKNRTDRRRSGR
jgi:hypothetical protein